MYQLEFTDLKLTAEGRILQIMNDASLALLISVGHRTKLFDHLFGSPPLMAHEIAERAGLQEPYVEAWLKAMTLGELITFDEVTGRYRLLPEFGALLSRAAGPDNAATLMQWFSVLGGVEDAMVNVFQRGGAPPVPPRERTIQIRAEDGQASSRARLFEFLLQFIPEPLAAGIESEKRGAPA